MTKDSSTIAALATAPFPSGIAVVRVSGPKTKLAIRALFKGKKDPVEDPRRLVFGHLVDFESGEVIDNALAVYMPGPHSYTGEDIGEFQFHGSPLLVQKILRSLFAFGVNPAEAGEFTKRAFLNGKLDLIQAEAISELINATSEQALKIAGEHLKGKFSSAVKTIGEPLRDALAEIDASVDFPEEDIKPQTREHITEAARRARAEIESLLKTADYGQIVREGFRVLLCGRPNVGKSSILNILLNRPRAIVSETSGTTRDLIEEQALIDGHRFIFCDSAGIQETQDNVEMIGIELAKERIPWADLVLFIVDATDAEGHWQSVLEYLKPRAKKIWMITNKIDLNPQAIGTFFCDSKTCAQNFYLSAKTRSGFESLTAALVEEISNSTADAASASHIVTNERQRKCLSAGARALSHAIEGLETAAPLEIISADLRAALHELEELVGTTYSEDIFTRIFSKFCIGK